MFRHFVLTASIIAAASAYVRYDGVLATHLSARVANRPAGAWNAASSTRTTVVAANSTASTSDVSFVTEPALQADFLADQGSGMNIRVNQSMTGDKPFVERELLDLGIRHLTTFDPKFKPDELAFVRKLSSDGIGWVFAIPVCATDAQVSGYATTYAAANGYKIDSFGIDNEPDLAPPKHFDCSASGLLDHGSWQQYVAERLPQIYHLVKAVNPAIVMNGPSLAGRDSDFCGPQGTVVGITLCTGIGDYTGFVDKLVFHDYFIDFARSSTNLGGSAADGAVDSYNNFSHAMLPACPVVHPALQAGLPRGCSISTGEVWANTYSNRSYYSTDPINVMWKYATRILAIRAYMGWNGIVYPYQFCSGSGGYIGGSVIRGGCTNSNGDGGGEARGAGLGEIPEPAFYAIKAYIAEAADPGPWFIPDACRFNLAPSNAPFVQERDICIQTRKHEFKHLFWSSQRSERETGGKFGAGDRIPRPFGPLIAVAPQPFIYTLPASCHPVSPMRAFSNATDTTMADGTKPFMLSHEPVTFTNNSDGTFSARAFLTDTIQYLEYSCLTR